MRQFFKFLFASCLGTLIALFIVFFIVAGGIGALVASAETPTTISSNSVLHLKLNQPIPELTDNIEPANFELNPKKVLGIHDLVHTIEQAKADDKIKGIFLEPELTTAGFTTLSTIRDAIIDFKDSGKFVYAYAPLYTQGGYYLSSASDEIALAPLGVVDWRGFAAQYPFYKDMLDRIGVDYEVFYAGRYKSASEPYRRNDMSVESREQTRAFLEEMYRLMLENVAATRNITVDRLDRMASTYTGINPKAAKDEGLVDQIVYREAFLMQIREQLGLDTDDKISFVHPADYYEGPASNFAPDKIAVIMAEGVIVDGKGQNTQIGDKDYVKIIENLRQDDDIKAVVLRVNSPGGSAMASDHIWQALMDLRHSEKPLVVSMGSVAASGGYYIAAPADHIFAEASTITGSIGVVSAIPQFQDLLKQKIGIHFDSVKTGPFANGINPVFDMSEGEKNLLRQRTDQMYETFLSRVSSGRGMPIPAVDSIAQGRIWVGTTALEKGLIDELGGLDEAIEKAASLADLDSYATPVYPQAKDQWTRLAEELINPQDALQKMVLREQLGNLYPYYQHMREMADGHGMQMRLPFMLEQ